MILTVVLRRNVIRKVQYSTIFDSLVRENKAALTSLTAFGKCRTAPAQW